jgi:hemerythrin-like domain-containing protein
MNLQSLVELGNTRKKLSQLEARYEMLRKEAAGDEELRDATMESLRRFINQLKKEVARFNAHQPAGG